MPYDDKFQPIRERIEERIDFLREARRRNTAAIDRDIHASQSSVIKREEQLRLNARIQELVELQAWLDEQA